MPSRAAVSELSRATRALIGIATPKEKPALRVAPEPPDVALDGATREGDVIVLGRDPAIEERAAEGAALHDAKVAAEKAYEEITPELRAYGTAARDRYNDRFGAKITTVKLPFSDDDGEERRCAITSSRSFKVKTDVILTLKPKLGDAFGELFVETEEEVLKPAVAAAFDGVLKGALVEAGVPKVTKKLLAAIHAALFEKRTTVTVVEDYEAKIAAATPDLRKMVDHAVTRATPTVKWG